MDSAIQEGYSSFRELARIAGTIIPVALAVGSIFVFLPGRCTSPLKPSQHGTTPFSLLIKLKFWYCNIDCLNGYSIGPTLATHTVVFSDASDVAFEGFSPSLNGSVVSGMWQPKDSAKVLRSAN